MASVVIAKKVDVSADAIWKLISNFGDTSWMPAGTQVTVAGSGVGMERRIAMGPDKSIVERLEALDPAARTLTYGIPVNVPFPVTNYHATMRVRAAGSGCELEWSASYDCAADAAPAIEKQVQGMYGMMIDWIAAKAK
ncbi:MAG: SRPBCC family protein [Deltaproteobacteria bacterium]|nr:SRPBCC family protein [Deltaproteobacteria bacterium]